MQKLTKQPDLKASEVIIKPNNLINENKASENKDNTEFSLFLLQEYIKMYEVENFNCLTSQQKHTIFIVFSNLDLVFNSFFPSLKRQDEKLKEYFNSKDGQIYRLANYRFVFSVINSIDFQKNSGFLIIAGIVMRKLSLILEKENSEEGKHLLNLVKNVLEYLEGKK